MRTKFLTLMALTSAVVMSLAGCKDNFGEIINTSGYTDINDLKEKLYGGWTADMSRTNPIKDHESMVQYLFYEGDSSKVINFMMDTTEAHFGEYEIDTIPIDWKIEEYKGGPSGVGTGDIIKVTTKDGSCKVNLILKKISEDSLWVYVSDGGEAVMLLAFDKLIEPKTLLGKNISSRSLLSSASTKSSSRQDIFRELQELAPCWMEKLSDATKLRDMSIPGSHDAATKGVPLITHFAACCQEESLEKQFKRCGTRAFDLRVRKNDYGVVELFHSCVPCYLTFKKAITELDKVLSDNQSECIILIIKTEGNDFLKLDWVKVLKNHFEFLFDALPVVDKSKLDEEATVAELRRILYTCLGSKNKIIEFKPDLTLGEARGKFVIINRNDLPWSSNYGAHATGWDLGKQLEYRTPSKSVCPLEVQDESEQDDDETREQWYYRKKKVFRELWEKSSNDRSGNTWYVNCASGFVKDGDFPDYLTNSNRLNPEIASIVNGKKGRGIILQDYSTIFIPERTGFDAVANSLLKAIVHLDQIDEYFRWYYADELMDEKYYKNAHGWDLSYAVIKNNFKPDPEYEIRVIAEPEIVFPMPGKPARFDVWLDNDENKKVGKYHEGDWVVLHSKEDVKYSDWTTYKIRFGGWYLNGKCVSTSRVYSFRVTGSGTYTGVAY